MIGLIFGETNLPKEILKKIKKIKKKYLIIDLTKNRNFKKDKNFNSVSIGQIGKIINILKVNNCKKVLFKTFSYKSEIEDAFDEISMLNMLTGHPNILEFYGKL